MCIHCACMLKKQLICVCVFIPLIRFSCQMREVFYVRKKTHLGEKPKEGSNSERRVERKKGGRKEWRKDRRESADSVICLLIHESQNPERPCLCVCVSAGCNSTLTWEAPPTSDNHYCCQHTHTAVVCCVIFSFIGPITELLIQQACRGQRSTPASEPLNQLQVPSTCC